MTVDHCNRTVQAGDIARRHGKRPAWHAPKVTEGGLVDTEAKVSSPGENGIVTGPS